MISSKASPAGPAPTCTHGCYTGAPTITKLNPYSKPSLALYERPVGRTAACSACCPARKDSCDRHRGLRPGNLTSVKRTVEHLGYAYSVTSDPSVIERSDRIILPGVRNFKATTALSVNVSGKRLTVRSQWAPRCSATAWARSGYSSAPTKLQE